MKIPNIPKALEDNPNVSRETLGKITKYLDVLHHWSKRTNLIGPQEWPNIWGRHVEDSLALVPHLSNIKPGRLVDLGPGAGFPAIVLACTLPDVEQFDIHLIETVSKKAAFLSEVKRCLDLPITIISGRIERHIVSLRPKYITARALADLDKLLYLSEPALSDGATAFFHKGANMYNELTKAHESWVFNYERDTYAPPACIIKISKLRAKET